MSTTTPDAQLSLTEAIEAVQDAAEPVEGQADRDTLPCGHAVVWEESGDCMACEPAWQTPAEREAREELELKRQPGEYE